MKCVWNLLTAAAVGLGIAASASGQVRINEMLIDGPGTDNGQEFIELSGPANFSLAGLTLLAVEGDGANPGAIDVALSLNSFSLGSNGLFLWRDSATIIDTSNAAGVQGPDPATIVNIADFSPDIENGSNTFLLVANFSGAIGNDLDTNNDGVLDSTPWGSVIFSIGVIENDGASNIAYAAQLGGATVGPNAGFNADSIAFGVDGLVYGSDVLGSAGGPYTYDLTRVAPLPFDSGPFFLTPGVANTVPGPAAISVVGLGLMLAGRRRR